MELYQLKSFIILAEEGSLRPAAERLFISQPTLSGHIKALEAEFGFELFERSHKGMLLTAEGEQFHVHAERVLFEAGSAQALVQSLRDEVAGTIRLGIVNEGRDLQLDTTIVALAQTYPKVQVDITNTNSGLVIQALRDGTFDVGFIEGERTAPELTKHAVTTSHPVIIYPEAWSHLDVDDWSNFQKHPWSFVTENCTYFDLIHNEVQERALVIDWKYHIEHNDTSLSLVKQGLAMGVVDREAVAAYVDDGSIRIWPHYQPETTIYLAWRKDRSSEKLITTYLETAKRLFGKNTQQA